MKNKRIELVNYTKGEEALNVLTHFAGLVIPIFIVLRVFPLCEGKPFYMLCAVLYALGSFLTFAASVVYHAVPVSDVKGICRIIDHTAIFFAVAGTITGCVPVVFREGETLGAVVMLVLAWGSVIAGFILTVFFFEKFRTLRMCIYIFSAALSALAGSRTFLQLDKGAFVCLLTGGAVLLTGCVLYRLGKRVRYVHCIFHVFILLGLGIYCNGIYYFVYNL